MRARVGYLLLALAAGGFGTIAPTPVLAQDQPTPNAAGKGKPAGKKPAKPASGKPAQAKPPVASSAPVVLPEPPLPTQQARKLELARQCTDLVDQMSRGALNSKYDVQSGWNRQDPKQHVFQSVAVIDRPEVTPANGLAAIIATPTPSGSCDGVTVQVFPLASDCATAQNYMRSTGASPIPILNTQIMIDRNGKRIFLLPGVNKTCIAVSVDSSFGPLPVAQTPPSPAPGPIPVPGTIVPHATPATPPSSEILPTAPAPK
ncbi:hypothetical protein C5L14_25690 [Labrys okinawensis]|uniref:Invasion associated locus B family protein n=1 Tax=Labrys okinawensis TaxID=346911 RepID=A0A2S9Q5F5_9HYPH|nr:hypothetical protein [Labrys okinawensis]PRH84598.1 hypothetical protein C5L14_25690 [Labrys okinawensis]